ncbi:MAG: prepilin-type N-terminal cleavage/methylation domain-containing protein [Pseudomonadota bacterium]
MQRHPNKAYSLIEISIVILIISVLFAGVTLSSRVVYESRLSTARTLTQSAAVTSIPNLVSWFDAVSENSFDTIDATDNVGITNWYDLNTQNTSKNNAQQSGATSLRPVYKASCLNNLPCLSFNGSSTYIETLATTGIKTSELTVFVVAKTNTISSSLEYSYVATSGSWVSGTNFILKQSASAGTSTMLDYQLPNSVDVTTPSSITILKPFIGSLVDNGTTATAYYNGNTGSSTATGVFKSIGVLTFGAYYDGSTRSRYLDGAIGEIIIFNRALKIEERKAIEKYLGKKWNITVS